MQESRVVQNGIPRVGKPLRVIVADDPACVRLGVAKLLHTVGARQCRRRSLLHANARQPARHEPGAHAWEVSQLQALGHVCPSDRLSVSRSRKTISVPKHSTMRKRGLVTERDRIDFATPSGHTSCIA